MLLNDVMTAAAVIFAALILLNILFIVLTRVPNPAPDNTFFLAKLVRPFAFVVAQLFIMSFCLGIPLLIALVTPGNPFAERYPELTPERVQTYARSAAGPEMYVFVFLFIVGMPAAIWMLTTISRRLHQKVWNDPGDFVSRLMRAWHVLWDSLSGLVFSSVALVCLYVLFQGRLARQIDSLSVVWRRWQANELPTDSDSMIAGGLFLIFAFIVLILTIFTTLQQLRTVAWWETEGEILSSRIRTIMKRTSKGRDRYELDADYQYTVDGTPYEGQKVMPGDGRGSYARAWMLWKRFPRGARVPVYYHPEQPNKAILIKGVRWLGLLTSMMWALLALTGFLLAIPIL